MKQWLVYAFDEAVAVINSVNYSINKDEYKMTDRFLLNAIYYNKDWYIADTYRGIISGCLDTDYRAKEEFYEYMNKINGDSSKTFKNRFLVIKQSGIRIMRWEH